MAKADMKLAIMGFGYWGRNLARNFYELAGASSLTICDPDKNSLKQVKSLYPGVSTTSNPVDILCDKGISAVVISTPASTHFRLARDCLLFGKDVFVEKPLSLTVAEGLELVRLSKKEKKVLMVGHLLEYHPGILKLKELIDSGKLGRINYIYSNRLNLGKIRMEENILWSFAPHDISVMLLLLNEMPVSVFAHGGNYLHQDIADVTISMLEFASGVKGHIFVSWLHPFKEQKLIVVGDKKMAVFDDVAQKDKLLLYSHKIKLVAGVPVSSKNEAEKISFPLLEPLREECRHFINCLETRSQPKTDGNNGIRVLEIINACEQSLERKSEVIILGKTDAESKSGRNPVFFEANIHPTAIVEVPCRIGKGTKIWHYAHVMKGAKIGDNCSIGQNVFIGSRVEVGSGVKIQNNVSVYEEVTLEDDVFCGPSVVFTNVITPRSHISRRGEFKKTLIKRGATLGANSTILCGIVVGEYAFVGAGAVVTKDLPAYALAYGNPARKKGWVCECGVKLNLRNNKGICAACEKKYVKDSSGMRILRHGS